MEPKTVQFIFYDPDKDEYDYLEMDANDYADFCAAEEEYEKKREELARERRRLERRRMAMDR